VPDSYDEVWYLSLPLKQSHPAFIAALSMIAGLKLARDLLAGGMDPETVHSAIEEVLVSLHRLSLLAG
jgi:hypothetical protein